MSWDLKPFGELYAIPSRNGLSLPADKRGHGCKMINMGELFAYPKIKNPDMARVQPSENEIEKYAVEKDDLLFARRSLVLEGAGKCAIVAEHEHPTVFESSIIRVRLNKEICDPVFYFYFFRSQAGFGFIQQIVNQVAVAGIRGSDLERMKIIYPPLPVQQKIAAILSAYDDLIEINNKRIALLEKASEEIYREWFIRMRFPGWEQVKFVKGVPEGWEYLNLNKLTNNFDKKRIPLSGIEREKIKGDIPYYGAAAILDHISKYIFDGKYLLFAEDGSVITQDGYPVMQLVNEKFWVNNHAHILQGKDEIFSTEWIYLSLKRYPIQGHVTGVAQPKINQENLNRIKVLVPKTELLVEFNRIVLSFFENIFLIKKANLRIQQSRDLLLSRLISGKLSVEALDIRFPPSMIAQ